VATNDELPLTTEAATFEELAERIFAIAPEIAEMNGLAAPGEKIEIAITAEQSRAVDVTRAA
jgi:hypothetical protein